MAASDSPGMEMLGADRVVGELPPDADDGTVSRPPQDRGKSYSGRRGGGVIGRNNGPLRQPYKPTKHSGPPDLHLCAGLILVGGLWFALFVVLIRVRRSESRDRGGRDRRSKERGGNSESDPGSSSSPRGGGAKTGVEDSSRQPTPHRASRTARSSDHRVSDVEVHLESSEGSLSSTDESAPSEGRGGSGVGSRNGVGSASVRAAARGGRGGGAAAPQAASGAGVRSQEIAPSTGRPAKDRAAAPPPSDAGDSWPAGRANTREERDVESPTGGGTSSWPALRHMPSMTRFHDDTVDRVGEDGHVAFSLDDPAPE